MCVYSNVYILVKVTIKILNTGTAVNPNNVEKKLVFKNCVLFTDCLSKINNT